MPFYWRLSAFYGFYFAVLGAFVPYWSVYLHQRGFSAANIGLLMALPQLTKIISPNLAGFLADRGNHRLKIIQTGTLLAAVAFCMVFWLGGLTGMLFVLLGFSFFWNAVLAQGEVLTLQTLGPQRHRYTHVRLWGSMGFIVAVVGLGQALESYPVTLLPWVVLVLLWLLWLATLFLPDTRIARRHETLGGLGTILRQPRVWLFFTCAFLMQCSHGPYYTFYTLYLQKLGISSAHAGQLWALGVVAEVSVFTVMHRLLVGGRFERIMTVSLALAALRWWMIAELARSGFWLVFAQLLHAASFASFHAACISWVQRTFGDRHAGQGQALYSGLVMGGGWGLGAWLSGLLWQQWGGQTFALAAGVAGLAALLSLPLLRSENSVVA